MAIEDRYSDLESLRSTTSGDVFRATHTALGRSVQICKIAETDESKLAALKEQVCTIAALGHPNITAIIDADWEAEPPFYVIDNVLDATLRERLANAPFDTKTGLRLAIDLFDALVFAHGRGIMHGGVSPARIYFDASGAARLGEFGANAASADPSGRTIAVDTDAMPYLPLSVLRNPMAYDEAADRHCAAAIVVHALSGSPIDSGGLPDLPHVPHGVVAALSRLLEPESLASDLVAARDACRAALFGVSPLTPNKTTAAPPLARMQEPEPVVPNAAPTPDPVPDPYEQSVPPTPDTRATPATPERVSRSTAALQQLAGRPAGGATVLEPVDLPPANAPRTQESGAVGPLAESPNTSAMAELLEAQSARDVDAELEHGATVAEPFDPVILQTDPAAQPASVATADTSDAPTPSATNDAPEQAAPENGEAAQKAAEAGSRVRDKLNRYAHLLR